MSLIGQLAKWLRCLDECVDWLPSIAAAAMLSTLYTHVLFTLSTSMSSMSQLSCAGCMTCEINSTVYNQRSGETQIIDVNKSKILIKF